MERWQDILDMTTLERVKRQLPGATSANADDILNDLITGYSASFMEFMDRWVVYRERVRLIDVREDTRRLKLHAWPIGVDNSGDPLIELYNDSGDNPSYSSAMDYPDAYRVYTDEDSQGRVEFRGALLLGRQALKVVWTGGMATKTQVTAADGVTANGAPPTLDSALATFQDDLVEVGMTVTVGTDTRTITSIPSQTQLEVDSAWTTPAGSQTYVVNQAGFVGRYKDIERALIKQIVFHWKKRHTPEIKAASVQGGAGMNITYFERDLDELIPTVMATLDKFRLKDYP